MQDDDDPIKDRVPWNVLAIAIVVVALLASWVWGRWLGGAGWPGSLGFTPKEWPAFWVGMWTSGLPTIAITAMVGIGAGLYLSNRDHRREEAERVERVEREISSCANRVAAVLAIGIYGVRFSPRPQESLMETITPACTTAYEDLRRQQLSEWARHVPRYGAQYLIIRRYIAIYAVCVATIASLDNDLDVAIKRHYDTIITGLGYGPEMYALLRQQRDRFRRYCICRMQRMDLRLIAAHLSLDREGMEEIYDTLWALLLHVDDAKMVDIYGKYRDDWEDINGQARVVREALESMYPQPPDPEAPLVWLT